MSTYACVFVWHSVQVDCSAQFQVVPHSMVCSRKSVCSVCVHTLSKLAHKHTHIVIHVVVDMCIFSQYGERCVVIVKRRITHALKSAQQRARDDNDDVHFSVWCTRQSTRGIASVRPCTVRTREF